MMKFGYQVKKRNIYVYVYIYVHKFMHIRAKNARQKCTSCINTFLTRRDKLSIKMISR